MKGWLALAVLLSWLRAGPLAAQSRPIDSLRALLRADQPDTNRVRHLQALAAALAVREPAQSVALAQQALALSRQLHYARGEGSTLIGLATAARLEANYPLARRYTRQALALYTARHDPNGLATTYLQLSLIDEVPGASLVTALREALQGLRYAEQAHQPITQLYLHYTLGDIYIQLGDYATALSELRSAQREGQRLGNEPVVAATLNLLGNTHKTLHHPAQALACFRRSARLYRRLGDLRSAATNEINLAELYAQQGASAPALQAAQAAQALVRQTHDAYNLPGAELALARAYLGLGQLDSAVAFARAGYYLSQHPRDNMGLASASDILAQAYARRSDFAQAYRYQRRWIGYQDSLAGAETQRRTSALRYGYELDRKQAQITLLTQARQLQRQQLWGLLATALVAGLLLRLNYLRRRTNRELSGKNAHIARQRDDLDRALAELQATQQQLVQSEKMVALAALTAGVAHEIQNPLNFVNNFAEVSQELIAELQAEAARPTPDAAAQASLLAELTQSLRLIGQHGQRASGIVRGMLEHARADKGQRQPLDLNKAAEEYLRLALHNQQLRDPTFELRRTFALDPQLPALLLVPQEVGRVLLNLFANAVYAVCEKTRRLGPDAGYVPEVHVSSAREAGRVLLRIRDNGPGIPAGVVDKIFEPFFTTKPTGEGTGLGLWFSYDIITKGYGGTLTVRTQEGEYTEFVIGLPLGKQPPALPRAVPKIAAPVAWAD